MNFRYVAIKVTVVSFALIGFFRNAIAADASGFMEAQKLEQIYTPKTLQKDSTVAFKYPQFHLAVFWATWCTSCKKKLKTILPEWHLQNKLHVWPVNIESDQDRVSYFLRTAKLRLPAYVSKAHYLDKKLGVDSVPFWALFKKQSSTSPLIMIGKNSGFDEAKILALISNK